MRQEDKRCRRCGRGGKHNPGFPDHKPIAEHHPLPRRYYGEGARNNEVSFLCVGCHEEADALTEVIAGQIFRESRIRFIEAFEHFLRRPPIKIVP